MSTLGNRLKELRKERGYSQAALGEKLGVGKSMVSMYENGSRNPSFEMLETIADFFNVDMDYLYGRTECKNKYQEAYASSNIQPIPETYQVPRLGTIACGLPILAEQNIETFDSVPTSIRCDFTLICKGDSMTGAGIEDGDIVYIREQPEVETGEIAAVMVGEEEATLKRFKRVGNMVLLIPENNSYEPLVFADGDMNGVRILGKAVGFTRHFRE